MKKMLSQELRDFLSGPFNQLIVNLGGTKSQQWETEFYKFLREEPCWISTQNGILELISVGEIITIEACDGSDTLANVAANHFHHGDIDGLFKDQDTNKPSEPTGEMEVCVHRLKNKASFQAMFGSLETDLDKLCLTQAQIGKFIKTYWDSKWLHVQHYRTCFLFKVNGRFVVVQIDGDGLHWYLIDDRNPWPPYDFRIVVPKIND